MLTDIISPVFTTLSSTRDLIRDKNDKIPIILMTGDGDPGLR
jgi:CheY-like chemotaxis protein